MPLAPCRRIGYAARMSTHTPTTRRGRTIPELLAGLAALALLAALVIPGAARMRGESRTASSLSQLRWIAGVTSSYIADHSERFWTFSWTEGETPSAYPDLRSADSDLTAAGYQALDFLRRRGREDIPAITGWLPHLQYSHLTLLDYLDRDIPGFNFVAPGDAHRIAWARDPVAFDAGAFRPQQPDPTAANRRWPYSASYELPPAFIDRSLVPGSRISQAGSHRSMFIPRSVEFGAPLAADVKHPSQKAHMYDTAQRQLGAKAMFFLFPEAYVPVLMTDGSARVSRTAESNVGWHPQQPREPTGTAVSYTARAWEPAAPSTVLDGHFRWTRGGIEGRDFGGPEVDTGQP